MSVARAEPQHQAPCSGRILVVDDVEDDRTLIARSFRRRGYEVLEASDGISALELIHSETVDAVLLDIAMPGMSGFQVLEQARARFSATDLPILMVTASNEAQDTIESLRLGANDYLTKPINLVVADARLRAQLERKQAEAHFRRAQEALRRQAEAANTAKSEFLATMSHEMRNPLNGIVALSELLRQTPLDAHQQELAQIIHSAGTTLDALLGDILDLARIEAGAVELKIGRFSISELVSGVARAWRLKAEAKGISFSIEDGVGEGVSVEGDELRLKQILNNLIGNAVKFTETGGVVVALGQSQGPTGPLFVLEVADTGLGVQPGEADRIFERFQQADGSITRRFGGTGLGLPISRELAGLMGGSLSHSPRPRGSVFTLTVPLTVIEGAAATLPAAGPATELASLRVLVADDHATNRKVVQLILDSPTIEVVSAENGVQAVALFEVETFDVILMDMQMPEMDGLAAVRRIRDREAARGLTRTPIIMLTANAMAEHAHTAKLAGADIHLSKPVTPASLIGAIEQALSGPVAAAGAHVGAA